MNKPNFWEMAIGDQAVYCSAVHYPDGEIVNRTDWQSGWNACLNSIRESHIKLYNWFSNLDEKNAMYFSELVEKTDIRATINEGVIQLWLNMNDVFCPAAVGENVSIDDLETLSDVLHFAGSDGIIAWVAHQRKQDPFPQHQTDAYQKTRENLSSTEGRIKWIIPNKRS